MSYKYPPLPTNPCKWQYTATGRIRQALGFEGSKIPASVHGVFKRRAAWNAR